METRADRTAGVYEVAEGVDIIDRRPFRPGIAVVSQVHLLPPTDGDVARQRRCLLAKLAYQPIIISRHDTGVEFRGALGFAVARPSPGLNGDEQFARAYLSAASSEAKFTSCHGINMCSMLILASLAKVP